MSGETIEPETKILAETERLVLRHWRKADLDQWLAHLNTSEVRRHLGGVETAEKVAEKFARLERAWAKDGFSFLAVDRREDGKFLGTCGIARIETASAPDELNGAIQIGWQLRADCWGQGFATEAAKVVLAMAFGEFGLTAVYAQTSDKNIASWRVMERLKMTRRADLDYDDPDYLPEENPTMVYAITREEWQVGQTGSAQ